MIGILKSKIGLVKFVKSLKLMANNHKSVLSVGKEGILYLLK